jgi:hypothetical protein
MRGLTADLTYGDALLGRRRKDMPVSYGETSGFVPVNTKEQAEVNGGCLPGGCVQMPEILKQCIIEVITGK